MNETRSENALDELLGKIVDEYLSALADGKKPDIKEYEDRYPEVAPTLRVAIPAILVATGSHPNDGNEGSQKEQRIGDFRILKQIGRGGMGIVYEAEQISMARNVALKVLPFAGLVDDLKIKRFQNEVRAVAALDHPNIVSVYMVGHDRGVHYYAMQLIRGQNLAQVISSLRATKQNGDSLDGAALTETGLWSSSHANDEPLSAGVGSGPAVETVLDNMDSTIPQESEHDYFRNVAILGVQAAKALQHAHDQGIVHRDIKPANLLLDRDANLYLTDFGLARIETDAGLTMTGDLIGTLRYMAPEQALGHRVGIDHRADIYSLAATIYELLALRPAFDAEDRQKLLKQIAFEDPASLRSVAPNIPVDLETIVRKAMSKDMEDRYASSEELAADLRCFLDHRPIKAKPPTIAQHISKWTRRNPRLVWTSLASLLIVTAILGVSTLLIAQQRNQAVANADAAKHSLYISEITQAFVAWSGGNLPRTQELLAKQIPADGSPDLRGVEWYYLASRIRANRGRRLLAKQQTFSVSPTAKSVCADMDDDLVLLDLETLERTILVKDIAKATAWIKGSAISPDETRVVVSTADGVRIIDVTSKDKESIFVDAPCDRFVCISPDGRLGAHMDAQQTLHLWDLDTARVRWSQEIPHNGHQLIALEFSPDSEKLAIAIRRPSSIVIANVSDGSNRTVGFEQDFTSQIEFLDNESLLISGGGRFGTLLVDIGENANATTQDRWLPPTRFVSSLKLSPTQDRIALGTESNAIEVWSLVTHQLLWRQYRALKITQVRFLDDTRLLYESGGVVETIDMRSRDVSRPDVESRYPWTNSLAIRGEEIAISGPNHEVVHWNPTTGDTREHDFSQSVSKSFKRYKGVINMASPPGSSRLAFTSAMDPTQGYKNVVRILNDESELVDRIDGMSVASMAFSADGKWLGLGTDGVTVYDTQTKSVHWASQPKRPTTTAVSFSPDGKWLAAGSGSFSEKDGLLSLYRIDGDSFECKGDFPHAQGVMCTRFSGDSQWLAAGDYAGKIVVYDLSTASPSETMSAHRMAVQCLEFSPDGKTLVSGAFNGSMKFWRVGRWEELGEVPHRNAVQGLRFYSSPSKGLGLLIGRRVTAAAPAEQEVHWIKQKDDDWNWLR